MELVRGLDNLRESHRGCAITVGGYDGIHLGHQALLDRVREHSRRLGRASMLVSFEPLPREFLAPADPPARLTSLREKCRLVSRCGMDYFAPLRFSARLRELSGSEFAALLLDRLRASAVVVGHDFRFGRNGEADAPMLSAAGRRLGVTVDVVDPVIVNGVRVSSSGIRQALARGDLRSAERGLGRAYSMRGRVVAGQELGRTLGFATANLRLERRRSPLAGIFAVRVRTDGPAAMPGVASLGTRPTVNGSEPLLEAHIFDFNGDLYGREIEVEFVAKLRDEEKFDSLDRLVEQMRIDAQNARRILAG